MARKKIGFGIVGCGVIGGMHADAVEKAPAAKLVAVADNRVERAKAIAEKPDAAAGCPRCSVKMA